MAKIRPHLCELFTNRKSASILERRTAPCAMPTRVGAAAPCDARRTAPLAPGGAEARRPTVGAANRVGKLTSNDGQ